MKIWKRQDNYTFFLTILSLRTAAVFYSDNLSSLIFLFYSLFSRSGSKVSTLREGLFWIYNL